MIFPHTTTCIQYHTVPLRADRRFIYDLVFIYGNRAERRMRKPENPDTGPATILRPTCAQGCAPGGIRDPYGSQLWPQRVPRTLPADPKNLLETRKNRMHVRGTLEIAHFDASRSKFSPAALATCLTRRSGLGCCLGKPTRTRFTQSQAHCGACPSQRCPLL